MLRKFPKPTNPYKEVYKRYAPFQFTLNEIVDTFKGYRVYAMLDDTDIYIVDSDNKVYLFLTVVQYDGNVLTSLYQASAEISFGINFAEVAFEYREDWEPITKLN